CPLTLRNTLTSLHPGHMEVVTWERVLEIAQHVGSVWLVGLGEPTTNPQFLRMLRDLNDVPVPFAFSTNGISVRREFVEGLAQLKHLGTVSVSIDSPDPDVYRNVRGGDVKRALAGLAALKAGLPESVKLSVSSIAMESTIESLVAFPDLLA